MLQFALLLCSGNSIKAWYTRSAKLAVAVAIIKSRPPGLSGRQHAEQLAARFNLFERSWKTKAEGLQEEVMRLRQELLLSKMLSKPGSENGGCHQVTGSLSVLLYIGFLCIFPTGQIQWQDV